MNPQMTQMVRLQGYVSRYNEFSVDNDLVNNKLLKKSERLTTIELMQVV